uniref:SOCS box domain-containing protein n=1 Tax=Colobus angolensis palliatus TaxID=336983 RepID=A0A2K5IM91_COLAP
MARETFPFTSSTLRSLRLQREWLEWEDRRRAAAQQCRSRRCPSSPRAQLTRPHRSCRDPAVHHALFSGDLQQVQALFQDEEAANMIVETVSNQLAWSAEQGFWVLTPKTKQTAPLAITTARGYTDCARHLIRQGAELDARVGGRAALHEACARAQLDCVRLLLTFGAKANVLTEEGMTPLHLCTIPESLCANGCGGLAELLLRHGARAEVPNGAGHTPMDCALQAVQDAPNWEPEVLFAALLDYGAQPVRPEMLKHCANFPRALEVLLNAYPCVPSCETWVEAVLPELWKEHEAFYSSALCMVNQPRRLQHLARLAVRAQLGSRCRQGATRLPLPPLLRDYLLLCVEGRIQ